MEAMREDGIRLSKGLRPEMVLRSSAVLPDGIANQNWLKSEAIARPKSQFVHSPKQGLLLASLSNGHRPEMVLVVNS